MPVERRRLQAGTEELHESPSVRHAEAVGVRSAGAARSPMRCTRWATPASATSGRASTSSSSSTSRPPTEARDARRRGRRQAARESGDRELSHRDRRTPSAGGGAAMKFAVVVFPGSNCDHDAYHAAKHVLGQEARVRLAQGDVARGRRRRDPAGRVLARRLPAHRRDRALLAGHDGGRRSSPRPAGRCSASATASRSCSRRACCRARCCATAT